MFLVGEVLGLGRATEVCVPITRMRYATPKLAAECFRSCRRKPISQIGHPTDELAVIECNRVHAVGCKDLPLLLSSILSPSRGAIRRDQARQRRRPSKVSVLHRLLPSPFGSADDMPPQVRRTRRLSIVPDMDLRQSHNRLLGELPIKAGLG